MYRIRRRQEKLTDDLMIADFWFWIALNAGVLCILAIDLFGFQRKAHRPTTKEAAIWTGVWVGWDVGRYFNLIAGTSTGGLLACGLAAGFQQRLSSGSSMSLALSYSLILSPMADLSFFCGPQSALGRLPIHPIHFALPSKRDSKTKPLAKSTATGESHSASRQAVYSAGLRRCLRLLISNILPETRT